MFHIIDDDECICEVIAELMTQLGYESKTFLCPVEYLTYTKDSKYSSPIAIFSDIRMPKMSGIEMMDTILEGEPDLKFILMSGYPLHRDSTHHQPYHYLSKPFTVNHVEELINSIVK